MWIFFVVVLEAVLYICLALRLLLIVIRWKVGRGSPCQNLWQIWRV